MIRTKHVFRQDMPALRYAALGDTAVRVLSIHHLVERYQLDALVVPLPDPRFIPLWQAVFGEDRVVLDPASIPDDFRHAHVSAPTNLDWQYGAAAWNVFESIMWEAGFFDTARLRITPPIIFPCNPRAKAAMIYPAEKTDGNACYDAQWWLQTSSAIRRRGLAIHHLGRRDHEPLAEFYERFTPDREYEPTIDGLQRCAADSSLAIGASTGPTWALLFSNIPQIVLESRRSPHGYWFFDRCQQVLTKRLCIVPTLDAALARFS
ncbi:MAG TPA: hypothetical protein VG826_25750 [Pirellulales bacterium]|nr:hypothetical protein [Pirellulales bacterium]